MPRHAARYPDVVALELKGVRAARVYEAFTRPHPRAAIASVVDDLRSVADAVAR